MAILGSLGKTPCVMDKLSKCVGGNTRKSEVSFMPFEKIIPSRARIF